MDAVKVTRYSPTCVRDGVHLNFAVAGFPSVYVKTAPCGTEAAVLIRAPTFGAAVLPAKLTESCVFAATPSTAPSGGVGATHETTASE